MSYTLTLTLLLCSIPISVQEDFKLLVLHTNDMHGAFDEGPRSKSGEVVGGCARVAYVVEEARKKYKDGKGPPALYFDAGDVFSGTIWFTVHKEKIAVDIMNVLKPDAMCLGNHEFDLGLGGLLPFLKNATFPIVTSNLKYNNEKAFEKLIKESLVLDVEKRKVGIVGYLTKQTKEFSDVGTMEVLDEIEQTRRVAKKLVKDGVDIIIAIGHSGYKADKQVAMEVEEVDLVIGGHTHTFLFNGASPDGDVIDGPYPTIIRRSNGKQVPVVQARTKAKYLGSLTLTFNSNGELTKMSGNPIFLHHNIPKSPDIMKALEKYRPALEALNTTVVGESKVYLDGSTCRRKECNFGNLVTDSFVRFRAIRYNESNYWTDASVSLLNSGAIRGSINASLRENNIYQADILAQLPFVSYLFLIVLEGRNLLKSLEIGVRSTGETSRGEFLMASGLKAVYDFTRPPGQRVMAVQVLCSACEIPAFSPLDLDANYGIVTTSFLLKGGDGHTAIKENRKETIALGVTDNDALYEYLNETGTIMQKIDGRTVTRDSESIANGRESTTWLLMLSLLFLLINCQNIYSISDNREVHS